MSALQRIARPVARVTSRRYMSSKSDASVYEDFFQKPTYDSLPKPKGSWQEDFNRRNGAANRVLAIGLIVGGATLAHALVDPLPPVTRADLPVDPRKTI